MKQQLKLKLGDKTVKKGVFKKKEQEEKLFTFGILFLGNVLERDEFEDYNDMLLKVSKNPFKYAPILMYESLLNTYKKQNKEVDFTEVDVVNWLDKDYEQGMADMLEFVQVFLGTNENKAPIEEGKQESNSKKK